MYVLTENYIPVQRWGYESANENHCYSVVWFWFSELCFSSPWGVTLTLCNVWKPELNSLGSNSKTSSDWAYIWISILKNVDVSRQYHAGWYYIFIFNHGFLGHMVLPFNHSSVQMCLSFLFLPFDLLKIHLHGFWFVIQTAANYLMLYAKSVFTFFWSLAGLDSKRKENSDRWQK